MSAKHCKVPGLSLERKDGGGPRRRKTSLPLTCSLCWEGNPRARAEPDVFYVQGDAGIDGWMGRGECCWQTGGWNKGMFIWMKGNWVERCVWQMKHWKYSQNILNRLLVLFCVWLVRVDAIFILTCMETRLCRIDVYSLFNGFVKLRHLVWLKSLFLLVFHRFCWFLLSSRFLPCSTGEMRCLWAVRRF